MIKFITSIGIPGSGKTSILKPFAEKNGYTYISSDEVRHEVTGSKTDMSRQMEVFDKIRQMIKEEIEHGHTVVFDSTLSNEKVRRDILSFAKECGAEKIQGLYIETPSEIAWERNSKREVPVPENDFNHMKQKLENIPPELSDGFDTLISIDHEGNLIEVDLHRESEEWKKSFKLR